MGILQKAIEELKYRIPFNILTAAFNDHNEQAWRRAPVSLDELIMTKVIRPRVIVDTNLVGGETVMVPLDGLMPLYVDNYTRVVEIPGDRINHRNIMTVLSAHYLPYGFSFNNMNAPTAMAGYGSVNDITSAAQRVNNSIANVPALSSAMTQLVSTNTVLIRDKLYISNVYSIRCVVANDENLENINPRNWHVFCKLCELAVKSYIYNSLILQIGSAYLSGGQELGIFRDIVDSYQNAQELYEIELREKWGKINIYFNNTEEYSKFIRMQISPGL